MVNTDYQQYVSQETAALNELKGEVGSLKAQLATLQAQNSGSKHGLLWLVVVIALAGAGFAGFTAYQNQNALLKLDANSEATKQQISSAVASIERSASSFELTQQQNTTLQQALGSLNQNYQSLGQTINGVVSAQQQQGATVSALDAKLQSFAERNPNDWKLAESYFMVNNAAAKAIFEKDIKAAVWMLTKADELLVGMQEDARLRLNLRSRL